uniref:Dynein axonemal assembly factor 5 n=1 Tax=Eptatretus burgeri TaxID=7764 RepID=A0A8C4QWF5_EPTBU
MACDDGPPLESPQRLARQLNLLLAGERLEKQRALDVLVAEAKNERTTEEEVRMLLRPSLAALDSRTEACRSRSLRLLSVLLDRLPPTRDDLPLLVPALSRRLSPLKPAEPAEELRLELVRLLSRVVALHGPDLGPYVGDFVTALCRCMLDPFAEVKKEACRCATNLANAVPEHFHLQAESLLPPLLHMFTHQHSRVRSVAVLCLGQVVLHSSGKTLEDVFTHLAQRLFDDAPMVRQAVTDVVSMWLLNLRDRYSYFHKLVPLLLSSLSDEMPDIKQSAAEYWSKIGLQWQMENEEDLKDKLDFSSPTPQLYPAVERPCLGCRELVQRNLYRLLPAVGNDIGDWVVGTRIKAAQLLRLLLLHAEDYSTQHMQILVTILHRACSDDESTVVINGILAAELIGTFVNPEVFLKLMLARIQQSASPSSLMVLASAVRCSSVELLHPFLPRILETLVDPDVSQATAKDDYHRQLVAFVKALVGFCGDGCQDISLQLHKILLCSRALCPNDDVQKQVQSVTEELSHALGLSDEQQLFRQHLPDLLVWSASNHHNWSSHSTELLLFKTAMLFAGPMLDEVLPVAIPIFRDCLQTKNEPELRLKVFSLLSRLLLHAGEIPISQNHLSEYLEVVVRDMIVPNLVWHAGWTSAALRTTAISSLWALLNGCQLSSQQAMALSNELLPQLISMLEEDPRMTRLLTCRTLKSLLILCGTKLEPDTLNTVYPDVLKRLDDSVKDVRLAAAQVLNIWFSCLGNNYDTQCYKAHLEFLYSSLLVYLDDPDAETQQAVLDALCAGSVLLPDLLCREVEAVQHKHRTKHYLQLLLEHVQGKPSAD